MQFARSRPAAATLLAVKCSTGARTEPRQISFGDLHEVSFLATRRAHGSVSIEAGVSKAHALSKEENGKLAGHLTWATRTTRHLGH
jgi:hypothetical protein